MADEDILTLQSNDGTEFKLTVKEASLSITVASLIADSGIEHPVPLPNVDTESLTKVVEFCKFYAPHLPTPKLDEAKPQENSVNLTAEAEFPKTDEMNTWDKDFLASMAQTVLFKTISAANYLDIKHLLYITCKHVAGMLTGKTAEQIREEFGIENDFTPEEEAQIRKENEWCAADPTQ